MEEIPQVDETKFYAIGDKGPRDNVWIRYDSRGWDIVERFGRRAVGKSYLRFRSLTGLWIPKTELAAIRALAEKEGALP